MISRMQLNDKNLKLLLALPFLLGFNLLCQGQIKHTTNLDLIKDIRRSYIKLEKHLYDKEKDNALKEILSIEQKIKNKGRLDLLPVVKGFYSDYYLINKDYEKAYDICKSALIEIQNSTNDEAKAYVYLAMGNYHHALGNYAGLSKNSLEALNHVKFSANRKLIGDIYYKMYCVHTQWDDVETDFYAQKALDAYTKTEDFNGMSNAYVAKSFGVQNLYEETKNPSYKDSIAYYLKRAVNVFEDTTDEFKKTKAIAALNLANHYKDLIIKYNNQKYNILIDSVHHYLNIVDNIPPKIDYNFSLRANSSNIKGGLAKSLGDIKSAEKYFLEAFDNLLKEEKSPSLYSLYNTAESLQILYEEKNNYKKAYYYLNKKYDYNSLIYDKQQATKVLALEAEYENNKIKDDLIYQQIANEQKQMQLWLVVGLLLISIVAFVFSYLNFKNKLLAKRRGLEILNKEKQRAIQRVKLEEEKNARLIAEQKVIQLEKERVSKKAMTNALQVERKNELLKDLGDKLKSNEITLDQLYKTLKIEKHTEQEISTKIDEFSDINPQFFEALKTKANKLTDLDLKYCAYIYLGLSNKEIASHLNVEQKSVRMTKYRIKKKLNLSKEIKLEDYLKDLH